MKIGVRLHDLGKSSAYDLAKKAKEIGFDGVQLVLNKAIEGESGLPGTLSSEKAFNIGQAFKENGVEIFMLGAYFNPLSQDPAARKTSIDKFKEHLKYCKEFGCSYVGSETGSYIDVKKWPYDTPSRTSEALDKVKEIFGDLACTAKEYDSNVAIEGAIWHSCYSPEKIMELYDAIDNGHVKIILDLFNFLAFENYKNQNEIFSHALDLYKDRVFLFHLKDFVVEDNSLKQVGLGQGIMDFDYILPLIKEKCPNAYLVFEGVKAQDMQESYDFITKKIMEA